MNKRSFWKDGFSIDETKFSILIVLLIIAFIYSLVKDFLFGDISANLYMLLRDLLLAVVGINVAKEVSGIFKKDSEESYYTEDENNNLGGNNNGI